MKEEITAGEYELLRFDLKEQYKVQHQIIGCHFYDVDLACYNHMPTQYRRKIYRLITPAPLSEQKQEGENVDMGVEKAAQDKAYSLIMGKYKDRETRYKVGFEIGFLECAQWQSQHTAKQIYQYKARIVELEQMLQLATSHINNPKPNI